jgi:DNA polymerase
MTTSAQHAAYLSALGVDVYVRRELAPVDARPGPVAEASIDQAAPDFALETKSHATVRDRQTSASRIERGSDVVRIAVSTDGMAPAVPVVDYSHLDWDALRAAVAACQRCELHSSRTQTVFGVGNPQARWMFIGEAPGQEEDRQGEPFVGRAGQLLNAMIRALGMRREDVFIANVLKCRPPGNRDPRPAEAASCRGFLERQVALIDPTLVIAVGRIAAQDLLATETPIAKLRGKVHSFGAKGWPLIVTYHPAYLLRSPSEKRKAWQDLVAAKHLFACLERERPQAQVQ